MDTAVARSMAKVVAEIYAAYGHEQAASEVRLAASPPPVPGETCSSGLVKISVGFAAGERAPKSKCYRRLGMPALPLSRFDPASRSDDLTLADGETFTLLADASSMSIPAEEMRLGHELFLIGVGILAFQNIVLVGVAVPALGFLSVGWVVFFLLLILAWGLIFGGIHVFMRGATTPEPRAAKRLRRSLLFPDEGGFVCSNCWGNLPSDVELCPNCGTQIEG